MSKEKFILLIKYSLIFGFVSGMISLIPYVNYVAALVVCTIASILIVWYMQKRGQLKELTMKGAAMIGAIVGIICLTGFLIINLPGNAILGAIFTGSQFYALSRFLLEVWWLIIFMGGLLSALFNSFALISYVYIRDTYFIIEGKNDTNVINAKFNLKDGENNNGI